MSILKKFFLKIENLGTHLKLFSETYITLTPKLDKNIAQRENYKLISHERKLKSTKQKINTLNSVIDKNDNTSQSSGFISRI